MQMNKPLLVVVAAGLLATATIIVAQTAPSGPPPGGQPGQQPGQGGPQGGQGGQPGGQGSFGQPGQPGQPGGFGGQQPGGQGGFGQPGQPGGQGGQPGGFGGQPGQPSGFDQPGQQPGQGGPQGGQPGGFGGQGGFGGGQPGQGGFGGPGGQSGQPGQGGQPNQPGQGRFGGGQPGQGGFGQPGKGGQPGGFGGGQPGSQGGQQGGFGQQGQGGMSEEQQQEQKKAFEERSKQVSDKQLKQIQKDMGNMEKQMIGTLKKQIAKVEGQGIVVPAELKTAIASVEAILVKVKALTSIEELGDTGMEDMGELMPVLQQGFQQLQQLSSIPKGIKNVAKQLSSYEKQYKKLVTAAQKVDLSDQLAQLRALLDTKQMQLTALGDMMKDESKIEGIFDVLQEEFGQSGFDDINEKMGSIQNVLQVVKNFSRFKSDLKRDLSQKAKFLKKFAKNPQGSALATIHQNMTNLLKNIEDTFNAKPLNIDNLENLFSDFEAARTDFDDALSEIQGQHQEGFFEAPQQQQGTTPSFDLPTSVGGLIQAPPTGVLQGGGPEKQGATPGVNTAQPRSSILPTQGFPDTF